jgi:hypothetical protein
VYARLADEIEGQLALLHDLVDVAAFNGMVLERGMGGSSGNGRS